MNSLGTNKGDHATDTLDCPHLWCSTEWLRPSTCDEAERVLARDTVTGSATHWISTKSREGQTRPPSALKTAMKRNSVSYSSSCSESDRHEEPAQRKVCGNREARASRCCQVLTIWMWECSRFRTLFDVDRAPGKRDSTGWLL